MPANNTWSGIKPIDSLASPSVSLPHFLHLSPDAHDLIFANRFCSQLVGCFAMDGKPTEPKRESIK
jgi:hypothetical protein